MPDPPATPADALVNLVPSEFLPLSRAEEKMLRAAFEGTVAYCGPSQLDDDPNNDASEADAPEPQGWGPDRTIRARLIRWLCVDRKAREFVDPKGIQVSAGKISGSLDLSFVTVPFPLGLFHCRLNETANLTRAQLTQLDLRGARTRRITAHGIDVQGEVFLCNGFSAEGEVLLPGAHIGGNLNCQAGTFKNPPRMDAEGNIVAETGDALFAVGLDVKGSVFLSNDFSAEGKVHFFGAQIGGDLVCHAGTFKNPPRMDAEGNIVGGTGDALFAAGIDIKGSVFLCHGFSAEGEVHFLGAQIGGDLGCQAGKFKNLPRMDAEGNIVGGTGAALVAERIDVKGGVFLCNGFSAEGEVLLSGAHMGGDLNCQAGTFKNPPRMDAEGNIFAGTGAALVAAKICVQGEVFLSHGFSAEGQVRLVGAQIGGTLDCHAGTFKNPPPMDAQGDIFARAEGALVANDINVKGNVFLRRGFSAEGQVRLVGAQIVGDLDCHAGTFKNPPRLDAEGNIVAGTGAALFAAGIDVKGSVFLLHGFSAEGEVHFLGAQIGGDLGCHAGTFKNPPRLDAEGNIVGGTGAALDATGIDVKGSVFLSYGFSAEGQVRLVGAQIRGNLDCHAGTFKNPPRMEAEDNIVAEIGKALDANGIDVKGSVFLCHGFSAEGEVCLSGALIHGNLSWLGVRDAWRATLDLRNAFASSVIDDPANWPGPWSLFLDGFTYNSISGGPTDAETRLMWLGLQPKIPFRPQPNRQLAKVLRESGDERGARHVLYEMENQLWRQDESLLAPLSRCLLRLTVGFGYRPFRILWPWAALVALGWLFFAVANHAGMMVPTQSEANSYLTQHHELPAYYEPFHPLIYSIENSLPFVKLGQVDRWQPNPRPRSAASSGSSWSAHLPRFFTSPTFLFDFLWAQILLGWLFATLFVAGVTGLVRRE